MEENTQPQSSTEQPKGTSPILVIGIVIVVIIIIGAFWLTSNQSKVKQDTEITKTQESVTTTIPTEAMVVKAIEVEGGEFYFKPNEIKVKKGEKVTITLKDIGNMPHDFVLDEFDVKSKRINKGETVTIEFTPDKAGTFEFYCSVGKHRQMGMRGNLIVE